MSPEERRCLEEVIYLVMFVFIFILSLPVMIKFMGTMWAKVLYGVLALLGVVLIVRLRVFLSRLM